MLNLIALVAEGDAHGYVLAKDVADKMGFRNGDERAVVSRLIWMKRLGYLDRIDPRQLGLPSSDAPRYVITPRGKALMGGKISATLQKALDRADPGTELLLMEDLTKQAYVNGDDVTAAAYRRQYLHTAAQRVR